MVVVALQFGGVPVPAEVIVPDKVNVTNLKGIKSFKFPVVPS